MTIALSLRQTAAGALAAMLLLAAGCGGTPTKGSNQRADQAPLSAFKVTPADLLLADALQRQITERSFTSTLVLVEGAAQKAPDRVDIAWLHAQLCGWVPGCAPEPLEARLRKLDPNNASVWIGALTRAQQQKDVTAENEILQAMGRGQRFDMYWNSLVSHIAIALNQTSGSLPTEDGKPSATPLTDSLNQAISWVSEIALPAFQPVSDACGEEQVTNPTTATRCGAIAQALQRGDSYLIEGVGLGIAERLAVPGSPRAIIVEEQIHLTRYQRDTAGQIISTQLEREKFTHEMLKLMTALKREQEVYVAVIRWAGQPVMPPGE